MSVQLSVSSFLQMPRIDSSLSGAVIWVLSSPLSEEEVASMDDWRLLSPLVPILPSQEALDVLENTLSRQILPAFS